MRDITVPRDNADKPLVFRGQLIGFATSEDPSKRRWTEVRIFVTEAEWFVVHEVGRSEMPGEVDLHYAEVVPTAGDAVKALYRTNEHGAPYLTRTARDAIRTAARHDPKFLTAIAERVA